MFNCNIQSSFLLCSMRRLFSVGRERSDCRNINSRKEGANLSGNGLIVVSTRHETPCASVRVRHLRLRYVHHNTYYRQCRAASCRELVSHVEKEILKASCVLHGAFCLRINFFRDKIINVIRRAVVTYFRFNMPRKRSRRD